MIEVPDNFGKRSLEALISGAVVWGDHWARLYKARVTQSRNNTFGDFTAVEADFDGYAFQGPLAYDPPFIDPVFGAMAQAPEVTFQAATPLTNPQTIYGAFVTNHNHFPQLIVLAWSEQFDAPIKIERAGDMIVYTPRISLITSQGV